MGRAKNGRPPNDRATEIAAMLAIPPLELEGFFADLGVRSRMGECISQAMLRPVRGGRKQPAIGVTRRAVKVRTQDR